MRASSAQLSLGQPGSGSVSVGGLSHRAYVCIYAAEWMADERTDGRTDGRTNDKHDGLHRYLC